MFISFHLKVDGLKYSKFFGFKFAINSNGNINGRHDQRMIRKKTFKDFSCALCTSVFLYEDWMLID